MYVIYIYIVTYPYKHKYTPKIPRVHDRWDQTHRDPPILGLYGRVKAPGLPDVGDTRWCPVVNSKTIGKNGDLCGFMADL